MKSITVRKQFLDFFESKQHKIVPSAPMVLKNDPTLLFTNSGMVPFKEFFLGESKIVNPRVTDSQKCLRVSGKHNDLDEVGKDTYHHTMFEMLGNWSFGDYFKKEAIQWAWELLTEVYKLNKEDLYVTVFEGDKEDGTAFDQEAYDIWKELISEDRILNGDKKDNFWEMGAQGPCGPCSEIHIDIRSSEEKAKVSGKDLVNMDHPQVIEIWNLVFMQFNRKSNGSLVPLKNKNIDTGMGFERLCMALQGKTSNYDTDIFTPLIREVETISGKKYGEDKSIDIAIRVIVDHVRAVAFSIADGQLPSNNGAGYVIRRILRRAIRYGFTFLEMKEPFIYRLVNALSSTMGDYFNEIKAQKQLIHNVVKEEEQSFLKTLDQGLILLDRIIQTTKGPEISGVKAFELYDTYGFPKDLTALILEEKQLHFNEQEFEKELTKQKNRSRAAAEMETDDWVVLREDNEQEFVGYDTLESQVKLVKYRKFTTKKEGIQYQLVFNLTPFYPEGGGQTGDKGYLELPNGNVIYILDTKKENNLIVHIAKNLPVDLDVVYKAVVDEMHRFRITCNHTATHLLHQGLRSVLGTHVEQKGSAVHSKNLRFDFSHFSKVTEDELKEVENFVNARIQGKLELVEHRSISMQQALDKGAMALFGEKYGDAVRMIEFGASKELCGGTHVNNTSDIWSFKIISEGAVASGIRRIEAITADATREYYLNSNKELTEVKALLKSPKNILKSVEQLQEDNAALRKQIEALLKEKASGLKNDLKAAVVHKEGVNILVYKTDLDAGQVKNLAFQLKGEIEQLFLVIGSIANQKPTLTVCINDDLAKAKDLNAGKIVRNLAEFINGGGGGQAFFATAGGKNIAGLDEALEQAKILI